MYSKTLFVFLVVYILLDFSNGHNNQEFFRKDYTYIEAVDSFYKFHTAEKNWRDAKRECDLEGASLFYPENRDEANAVISFWTPYQNNTPPDNTWVFVGISDIITEGVYETIDGKSISEVYNNWKLNQPDNSGDEDCLHLNQEGNFNYITCDAKYSFICKKTLPSLERNCSCNNQQSNLDGHNNQVNFRKDYTYIEAVESFYKIYTTKKNWRDAKRHCDQEGASLFYPENRDEANAVISFWTLFQNNTLSDDTWVFVGISDIITEGVYETIDGKSISEVYNNWRLNQPDNSGDEDCLHLHQEGNFNDITCDAKYSFICKKTLPSLERNCSCNNQQSNLDGHNNQVNFRKDYTYIEAVDSFYKIYTTKKNWRDAKRHCDQEGASLFYPENRDEANAVISFWTLFQNNTLSDDTWVFVGISDIITEGVYETIDGKSISEVYNNWRLNQPDNSGDEDCLHLHQEGNFNDITCDAKYSFICKKTLPSLERNCSCNNQQSNLDGHNNQVNFRKDYTYIEAVESFYKIYTTKKNWRDAKRHCDQEGASLFYPENRDEANAVISFWTLFQNNTLSDDTWVFVGISDIITEGVYETIDGKSISEVYNNWRLNQPDNSGDEDCLHLHQEGNFNDITCDAKYSFICKKTLPSLERNCSCNNQQSNLDGHNNQVNFRKDYTYIEAVDSFYKIYTTKKNWRDAKRHCDQEGASLFYPENRDEANAVISFWTLFLNNTLSDDTWVFVGISDIITEGVYETIDGKSISEVYNNWRLNQPDNSGDEDCLHLHQEGNFNDITCDAKYSFICKKTLPSLERNCSCNNQQSNLDGHNNQVNFRKDYTYIEAVESFYKIYTTKKNWRDAKRHCDQEGASLFYPENGDEANAVISFWTLFQNNTLSDDTWVFVGISDIITEGVYETIDGKSISEVYNNWKLNQPDNSGDEDCLHLNQEGNFNDITCDAKYSFICKKTLPSLERNCSCNNQQSNLDGQRDKKNFRKDYTYIESEESFYKVHMTAQSFADAMRMCALEGASLFYAENEDEANAVILFWNRTQPIIPWVFVGLSDITVEGFFETVDQRPITEVYSRWQKNQPDNSGGKEDCVHMDLLGTMNDCLCNPKSYFICKKSLQSLEWNYNCNMPNLDYTFNKNTGKCYKLHTTPLNWAEAYAMCRIEYTSLAVTSNRMEADYLANLTKSTPKPSINEHYQRGIYHLGFHNRFNEGWQTVRGTPMNVDADVWFDHQWPDRNHYEECGSMFFNGRLINTDCNTKSMFICEHEVDRWNEF